MVPTTHNPVIRMRARPEVHARLAKLVPVATEAGGGAVVSPTEIARRALLIGLAVLEGDIAAKPGLVSTAPAGERAA